MYHLVFTVTGAFAAVLGALLLLAPDIYLKLYVVEYDQTMAFAAQRLAPAIVGLGALLLLARDLPPGPFAARFAALTALVWFGVAATGVFHFSTGSANANILVAAALEILLGLIFLVAARGHRAP